MAFLRLGLIVGAVVGAFVLGGALDRGFTIEIAILRGAVAFMGVAFVGYLGELVIVTAPARQRKAPRPRDVEREEPSEPLALPSPPQLAAPAVPIGGSAVGVIDNNSNDDAAVVESRQAA